MKSYYPYDRLFPTDPSQATKNGNTPPGTVVDKGITEVFVTFFPSFVLKSQRHNDAVLKGGQEVGTDSV